MARRNVDPTTPRFYSAESRKREFTLLSDGDMLITHFDAAQRRSRVCGGPTCRHCQYGSAKLARWYFIMIDSRGKDWLLELRARHMETLDNYERTAGLEISIVRKGTALNSPIEIAVIGEREIQARDIKRLVATFGLAAEHVDGAVPLPPLIEAQLLDVAEQRAGTSQEVANPPGFEDYE